MRRAFGGTLVATLAAVSAVAIVATTGGAVSAAGPSTPVTVVGGTGGALEVFPTVVVNTPVSVPVAGCAEPDHLIEVTQFYDGVYTFLGYSGPTWNYIPAPAGVHELVFNCYDWTVTFAERAAGVPRELETKPVFVNSVVVSMDVIESLPNIPVDYVASVPGRLLDTRADGFTVDNLFAKLGKVSGVTVLDVAGRFGVPADAEAVALNITATETAGPGFVTVYPCGTVPNSSNLNFVTDDTVPNLVITKLTATGKVCLFSSVATHLIADLSGYYPAGSTFESLAPGRILDSRPEGATIDGQFVNLGLRTGTTELQVTGRHGVPGSASAVALNVTATEGIGSGFATVYPCGADRPNASNLNFVAGETIPNLVITQVGAGGKVCLFANVGVHLIVDVAGYMPAGNSYTPITPGRLLDTRADGVTVDNNPLYTRIGGRGAGVETPVKVTVRHNIPVGARAVVLNVTAVGASAGGFVKVYPCGTLEPNASNLNLDRGDTRPNAVIAKVGSGGRVCLKSNITTDLIVDVAGYFIV